MKILSITSTVFLVSLMACNSDKDKNAEVVYVPETIPFEDAKGSTISFEVENFDLPEIFFDNPAVNCPSVIPKTPSLKERSFPVKFSFVNVLGQTENFESSVKFDLAISCSGELSTSRAYDAKIKDDVNIITIEKSGTSSYKVSVSPGGGCLDNAADFLKESYKESNTTLSEKQASLLQLNVGYQFCPQKLRAVADVFKAVVAEYNQKAVN